MERDFERLYYRQKKLLLADQKEAAKKLASAQKDYDKLLHGNEPRKEIKLQHQGNKIGIYQKKLDLIDSKLRFLRPGTEEDVSYRLRQCDEFSKKINSLVPDDVPLRFHGCPIYAAEKIIQSGEISSSVDRLGFATSYDGAGQISVTDKNSIDITIQGYTDLSYNDNLPAGCVFVVTPQDLADEKSGEHQLMNSVDFKSQPERFVAVVSTPENVPSLQSWLQTAGLDKNKAVDFDGFVSSIGKFLRSVRIPYRSVAYNGNKIIASIDPEDLRSVLGDPAGLQRIQHQTPELCLAAVRKYPLALKYVKELTPEICMAAVKGDGNALQFVRAQSPELCAEAVRNDPLAIKHVIRQTPELCKEAVQHNSFALKFIRNQTEDICLNAVKLNGMALQFVRNPTLSVCKAAVRSDPRALSFVPKQFISMLNSAPDQHKAPVRTSSRSSGGHER